MTIFFERAAPLLIDACEVDADDGGDSRTPGGERPCWLFPLSKHDRKSSPQLILPPQMVSYVLSPNHLRLCAATIRFHVVDFPELSYCTNAGPAITSAKRAPLP
jgi:hypothetical protein